jgi:cytochrome P450
MNATTAPSFTDPAVIACPYDAYRRLQQEAPVYRDPGTGTWVVTRYEDVRRILLDPLRFSSEGYLNQVTDRILAERAERLRDLYRTRGWLPDPALGFMDDPKHAEVRAIFERAFRGSRIRELDPQIRQAACDLVDRIAAHGATDYIDTVAVPLPLKVTGLITRVPDADLPLIRRWTEAFIRRFGLMLSEDEERDCVLLEIEGQHYLKQLMDRLRAAPDDSLLSDIVNTPMSNGECLSDAALFAHLMADTFVGGSETTTSALASAVRILCEDRALQSRLRSDPENLLRTFIEEVLRLESPVQGLYRMTTEDVTIRDVTIPKRSVVNVRYAAANRDPAQFADPECPSLERRNAGSHLAFGSGIHACVGATLARRELYWALHATLDRLQDLRLAPGTDSFKLAPSLMLRRLAHLQIEFTPG